MLLGTCVEIAPREPGPDPADDYWKTLAGAVADGLAVEFWPTNIDWTPYTAEHLRRLRQASAGAPAASVHSVANDRGFDALRHEFAVCRALGATVLVVHGPTLGLTGDANAVDYESISRIARQARDEGIVLALENLTEPAEALAAVAERLGDDPRETGLGICVDVGHVGLGAARGLGPVSEYLERVRSHLVHLHLHDVKDGRDHLVPGDGGLDWAGIADKLGEIGFQGCRLIELNNPERPLEMIRRSRRFLESVFAAPEETKRRPNRRPSC
jgi:sugar phosphate isomerase/epimerase